jgi:hypothetical protein
MKENSGRLAGQSVASDRLEFDLAFVVGPLSDLVFISKAAYRGRSSEPSNKALVSYGLG